MNAGQLFAQAAYGVGGECDCPWNCILAAGAELGMTMMGVDCRRGRGPNGHGVSVNSRGRHLDARVNGSATQERG